MSKQVAEIKLTLEEAEAKVKLGEALKRLTSNKDFKKVILEAYFEKEAVRLVHSLGDPAVAHNPSVKEEHTHSMHAIAQLRSFLFNMRAAAEQAELAVEQNTRELELIRGEEAGDDEGEE